jgi:hypothetical protein
MISDTEFALLVGVRRVQAQAQQVYYNYEDQIAGLKRQLEERQKIRRDLQCHVNRKDAIATGLRWYINCVQRYARGKGCAAFADTGARFGNGSPVNTAHRAYMAAYDAKAIQLGNQELISEREVADAKPAPAKPIPVKLTAAALRSQKKMNETVAAITKRCSEIRKLGATMRSIVEGG